MSFTCNGICHKVETLNKNGKHYSKGEKFCAVCNKFLLVFSTRCCCCNSVLRINEANKKSRGF